MNRNNRLIIIGFYGGESLLNFQVIEKTVNYCKNMGADHLEFNFNITTNAVLLDKYADYLVENNFKILFSLDGDEKGNYLKICSMRQKELKSYVATWPWKT